MATDVELIDGGAISSLAGGLSLVGVYAHDNSDVARTVSYVGPESVSIEDSCFQDNTLTASAVYCQTTDTSTPLDISGTEFVNNVSTNASNRNNGAGGSSRSRLLSPGRSW